MATKNQLWSNIEPTNPFKVPEGYFEQFQKTLLSNLPEKQQIETPVLSLWDRVKPWVYMAAMFAGIALMVKIFVVNPDISTSGILAEKDKNITSSEIDEFYNYYEDQYASANYRQVFILDEVTSE